MIKTEKEIREMIEKTPMIDYTGIAVKNALKWVLGEYPEDKKDGTI